MGFIDKPQAVWLRRASFQIHLWLGVALAVYFALIGVTGSILVFRADIERWMLPAVPPIADVGASGRPVATLDQIVAAVKARHPDKAIISIRTPHAHNPAAVAYIPGDPPAPGANRGRVAVTLDPYTAAILDESPVRDTWLAVISQLHIRLLSGQTGFLANGIGAAVLLALCLSGAVIWWPGIKAWRRALTIDPRKSWKRINFDLHSAVGFWTLLWVTMWSVTTIYFVWPREVSRVVRTFSTLSTSPRIVVPPRTAGPRPSLNSLVAHARTLYPGDRLAGAFLANGDDDAVMLQMARARIGDFTQTDFVYFDPSTGAYLGTFRRGVNHTIGDWIVWLMFPLHFGTDWGLIVKILWALAGLSLPVLAFTGLLMYWNRYLSKQWKRKPSTAVAALRAVPRHD